MRFFTTKDGVSSDLVGGVCLTCKVVHEVMYTLEILYEGHLDYFYAKARVAPR